MSPGIRAFILLATMAVVAGCDQKARYSDESEREHPAIKKARELESTGDIAGARFIYQALLDRDPSVARAHLGLAFLLEKQGSNSVDAIYHYQRYLSLRPDTEKRRMIQDHIRSAQLYYVGTVFSSQTAILNHLDELEREHAALIIHSANLAAQATQLRATVTALRGNSDAKAGNVSGQLIEGGTQTPRSAGRVVKVAKGDTLRIISLRYYGDPERWRDIFEANREQLKHTEALQIGQSIVVPDHRR